MYRERSTRAGAAVVPGTLIAILLLPLLALPAGASGGREQRDEGAARTEAERRSIEVYMLHREPGSSPGAGVPRPAGEAAWYLFREVRIDGSTVRAAGSRRLSGPVQSRESRQLTNDLQLTTFRMELIPAQPLRYRPLEEIRVRFTSDELIAGGRALMQPAQKAIILAASRIDRSKALVRVKSLRMEGEKRWTGVVEIAERLP